MYEDYNSGYHLEIMTFLAIFFNTEHGKGFFPKMLHVLHRRLVEHSSTMAVTSKTLQNNNLTLCGGLGKCLQAIEKKVENQRPK